MPKPTRWQRFCYFLRLPAEKRTSKIRWKSFRLGLGLIIILTLVSLALQRTSMFEKMELGDLDRLMRAGLERPSALNVGVVLISDDDYAHIFNHTSPLAPDRLLRLVENTCLLSPKIVGVDILTSDWTPDQTQQMRPRLDDLERSGCHIVWIRDVDLAEDTAAEGESHESRPGFVLGRVVGQANPPEGICSAVPLLFPDADGVIRSFRKSIPVYAPGAPQRRPYVTLAAALALPRSCGFASDRGLVETSEAERKIRFGASRDMAHLPAGEVYALDTHASDDPFRLALQERFAGATVIIGGAYRAARDQYPTPVGYLFGSEIIGDAVSSLYDPIPHVSGWLLTACELVVDVVCLSVVVLFSFRLPWALLVSAALSLGSALLLSFFLFHFAGYFLGLFASTFSVLLAAVADALFEYVHEDWETWRREWRAFKGG